MTLGELEALEESMARMDAAEDVEETAEEEDETDPVTGIAEIRHPRSAGGGCRRLPGGWGRGRTR